MDSYRIVYSSDSLAHHGIKGQKWGVRRFQNEDMSLTPAGKERYGSTDSSTKSKLSDAKSRYKSAKKSANNAYAAVGSKYEKMTNGGKTPNKLADRMLDDAADKWAVDRKSAKESYKLEKNAIKRNAVKEYSKAYDKAEAASNIADKKWSEVNEQYKALGRNKVERIIKAAGKSDAAKAYSKAYDEASSLSDAADKKWKEAKSAYIETGKNHIDRIFNNIKYRD